MKNAAHTPGPWELTFGEYDAAIHAGATIAMVDDTMSAWKANARLIAAAPELLETLQYVLDADQYDGALTMGTAALSPAIRDRIKRAITQATQQVP